MRFPAPAVKPRSGNYAFRRAEQPGRSERPGHVPRRFERLATQRDSVKSGRRTISPPLSADWWAQMPTQVQLADCTAFG